MKHITLALLLLLIPLQALSAQQTILKGEGVYIPGEVAKINANDTELYARSYPAATTAANDFSVGNGTVWQTKTLAQTLAILGVPTSTAANDFYVGDGAAWQKKTLAETKTILSVPSALSELTEDATHRVATDAEKTAWNAKAEVIHAMVDASTSKELSVANLSRTIVTNDGQVVSADVAITTATLVSGLTWKVIMGETLDSTHYWQLTVPVGSSIMYNGVMGASGGKCRFTTPVFGDHASFTTFTNNGAVIVLCESSATSIACD